jgi:Zn-dependent protease
LQASLVLAAVGLLFGVAINLAGAYFSSSRDAGMRSAGQVVLVLAAAPHLASIANLLVLTPEDWTHTITHVLNVMLIAVGLTVSRSRPTAPQ